MSLTRRVIIFAGRVQGVGFRYTACELAKPLRLSGTVRNLTDGTVELVAEGHTQDIDQLVRDLRDRFAGFILNVVQTTAPTEGLVGPVKVIY